MRAIFSKWWRIHWIACRAHYSAVFTLPAIPKITQMGQQRNDGDGKKSTTMTEAIYEEKLKHIQIKRYKERTSRRERERRTSPGMKKLNELNKEKHICYTYSDYMLKCNPSWITFLGVFILVDMHGCDSVGSFYRFIPIPSPHPQVFFLSPCITSGSKSVKNMIGMVWIEFGVWKLCSSLLSIHRRRPTDRPTRPGTIVKLYLNRSKQKEEKEEENVW